MNFYTHFSASIKALFAMVLLFVASSMSFAYDFCVGGIYYNLSDGEAIVTYPNEERPATENPSSYSGDVTIPATVVYDNQTYKVTAIGERAFYRSSVKSVTMSEGLQSIQRQAFSFCNSISELRFPNSVKNLGFDAVAYCEGLDNVYLGTGIEKLEQGVFYSSNVNALYVSATTPLETPLYFMSSKPVIYVKQNVEDAYNASAWATYGTIQSSFDVEYSYSDLQEVLESFEAVEYASGIMPGQYSIKSVEAYTTALNNAKSLDESASPSDISSALKNIVNNTPQIIPLSDGYYRIISAGNGPGYSEGPYNYENKVAWYNDNNLVKWKNYDSNNYGMIYMLHRDGAGWNIFNLKDKSFVEKGTGSFNCNVSTSTTASPQLITAVGNGKFIIQAEEARFIYAMTHSHNGSNEPSGTLNVWGTPEEAEQYGVNLWYFVPVSEEIVNYLEQNDDNSSYSIGDNATTPVAGKKYVIRNASTQTYLPCTGALTTDVVIDPEYFWTLEESGNTVDGQPTYWLKSVMLDKYWKYINFAEKTWADGTPYDAYDWYDYAGLNGEFSDSNEAMEVTVVAAGSGTNWRSQGASSGYVIAMRDPVVTNSTYYYKLGCQDNNVGMEPWNENVGWEFYPVITSGNDNDDIQNAIDTYGTLDTNIETSEDPGFYSTTKMDAYKNALNTIKGLSGNEAHNVIQTAITNLKNAYDAAKEPNPMREGYFYIVTAGNGSGYSGGPYNYEWKSAMFNGTDNVEWADYDTTNYDLIYYISKNDDGNWNVCSALNGTYIGKGASSYSTKISVTESPQISQEFTHLRDGKWIIKFKGNPFVYTVAASHNGSKSSTGLLNIWGTPEEANKYGVNLWYIHAVPDEVMEQFSKTDAGLVALCTSYEKMANSMEVGTTPGYYKEENVNALKATIATAKQKAYEQTTDEEKMMIRKSIYDAYEKAQEVVPLTDGYYYIINNYEAYKSGYGNYPAIYTAPEFYLSAFGSACYYDTFNKSNANYIYKVEKTEGNNAFSVKNAYTDWYLNTGDGNGSTGEVMTCSKTLTNSQIIKWYSAGRYWMADATDNAVGHALANAGNVNKRDFVVGGPGFDASISNELNGYNTWSFVPLSETEVQRIIAEQKNNDALVAEAYNEMVGYRDSVKSIYNQIINDKENTYNADAVIVLNTKAKIVEKYISSRSYDISSTIEDYKNATDELRVALKEALEAVPDTTTYRQILGTPFGAISVDYNNNQPSTTVNTPNEVFDNDFNTYYASYERSTGYVGLDLGEKHIITRVAYAPRASWSNRMVLGVFEGANKADFSDAVPFHIIKNAPPTGQITYEDVDCSRGFRYVRYVGPNDARCNVSELRFYGNKGEGDDSHLYQLTNLPLVVIRTDANVSDVTSKTTWLPGHINIISDDGATLKADSMKVRGRGNGSWTFEKKPYKFKLENKAKLLGMPAKAKEWTLINNYGDKTMIRNNVAFKLSEIFEMAYTPACTLVDVVFNGQYKGSYQLCDQVEVHKNRVEVTHMDADDNAGDSITGGYLIELDAYAGGEPRHFTSNPYGIPVTVHYPDNDDITTEQFKYIQEAFNEVCRRVYSAEYKDSINGYSPVFDEESWLKYFLIEELSGNTDGYWSTYLTKDRNGKFITSPVWDFDLAFDNDGRTHPILTMTDFLSLSGKSSAASGVRNFNRKIVESCSKELKALWSWYRYRGDLNYEVLHAAVDSLGTENALSAEYNYIRWPILNVRTQQQYTTRGSYKAEVDFVSEYLYDRIAWLDNKVGLEEPIGIHSTIDEDVHGGIHGHEGYVLIRGFAEGSTINIYTPNGTLVSTTRVSDFNNSYNLPKGIYIVKVTDINGATSTQKVAVK